MYYVGTDRGTITLPTLAVVEALADLLECDLPYSTATYSESEEDIGNMWHSHNDDWFDYVAENAKREAHS